MFSSSNFQILRYVFLLYSGWSAVLFLIYFFGLSSFPHFNESRLLGYPSPSLEFWSRLANWDGGHFRGIAENGYKYSFQVVFFPLYPLLIKLVMVVFQLPSLLSGLIVSNSCAVIALFFLYKLVLLDYKDNVAKNAVFLTLAFPTSFYFGTIYSESLFFALTISSFYFIRTDKKYLAFILAGLTGATRLAGAFVILAITYEYLSKNPIEFSLTEIIKKRTNRFLIYLILANIFLLGFINFFLGKIDLITMGVIISVSDYLLKISYITILIFLIYYIHYFFFKGRRLTHLIKFLLLLFLSSIPFLIYSYYLYQTQNNPIVYTLYEENWGRHFGYPWQVIQHYWMVLSNYNFFVISMTHQALIEFLFTIIFMVGLFFSFKKLRLSYSLFYLSIILPMFTGTLSAIHRYGLVLFPLIILIAQIKNPILIQIWTYFSIIFLGFLAVLFFNGFWVT